MSGFLGVFEGKKCYVESDGFGNKFVFIGNSRPILFNVRDGPGEFYWHLMFEAIEWKEL